MDDFNKKIDLEYALSLLEDKDTVHGLIAKDIDDLLKMMDGSGM